MLKRVLRILPISLIILLLFILINSNLNDSLDIYKFDIYGSDLEIENYTLVTSRNEIYISDSCSINVIGEDKDITEIKFIVQSDDDILTDLIFEFPNSKHLDAPIDRLINGHLNKDKELTILFEYKLNGVQKEYYHTVNLEKNKIKEIPLGNSEL